MISVEYHKTDIFSDNEISSNPIIKKERTENPATPSKYWHKITNIVLGIYLIPNHEIGVAEGKQTLHTIHVRCDQQANSYDGTTL
jgi:hypothetical protein